MSEQPNQENDVGMDSKSERILVDNICDDRACVKAFSGVCVEVMDKPGPGNACHEYRISVSNEAGDTRSVQPIHFQKGPIKEHGHNGIDAAALLAILIDRFRGFQSGPYACRENAIALTHLEEALMWDSKRTADRICQGIEGTSEV